MTSIEKRPYIMILSKQFLLQVRIDIIKQYMLTTIGFMVQTSASKFAKFG